MAAWRWVFMGPESSREPRVRANRRAVFGLQPRHQVFDVDLEQPKPVVGHVLAGLRPVLGVELVEERLELRPRGCGVAALERRLRSEEHTSELQSLAYLVCRLLLEKKKK